jgi:hypothetical protein
MGISKDSLLMKWLLLSGEATRTRSLRANTKGINGAANAIESRIEFQRDNAKITWRRDGAAPHATSRNTATAAA